MKLKFSLQIFEKYPNVIFHERKPSGNRVVPCGWTGGQIDVTKLIVAYRNFAKRLKMILKVHRKKFCPTTLKQTNRHKNITYLKIGVV
jgi:hypothetical protein